MKNYPHRNVNSTKIEKSLMKVMVSNPRAGDTINMFRTEDFKKIILGIVWETDWIGDKTGLGKSV